MCESASPQSVSSNDTLQCVCACVCVCVCVCACVRVCVQIHVDTYLWGRGWHDVFLTNDGHMVTTVTSMCVDNVCNSVMQVILCVLIYSA